MEGRSPRRSELQGPRPAPLRIHKDSHKIRKPPVVPQPPPHQLPPRPHPARQPVIIYTVSPKIIHTNPNDFMNLVQRLTGLGSTTATASTSTNTTSTSYNPSFYEGGAISPAARYATIEKANINNSPQGGARNMSMSMSMSMSMMNTGFGDQHNTNANGIDYMDQNSYSNKGLFSGILSPGPASLPPITPNFFSPPSDAFFHDLISPAIHNNMNSLNEGSLMAAMAMASPMAGSSLFVSPTPNTPSLDHLLFTNIFSDNF